MNPTEHELVIFFVIIIGSMSVLALGITIYQGLRRKPTVDEQFATNNRVDALEDDMDSRIDKLEIQLSTSFGAIDHKLDDHNRQAEKRSSLLHGRINNIATGVSTLAGRCSAMHGHKPLVLVVPETEEATG